MSEPYEWLLSQTSPLREKVRHRLSIKMDQGEKNDFAYLWEYLARPEQLPPPGDWRVWMIMAGRGFGKTRSGAEWVRMIADANPRARIALVSSSLAEARAVMVEGESGLLGICRPGYKPLYEPRFTACASATARRRSCSRCRTRIPARAPAQSRLVRRDRQVAAQP